MEKLYNEIEKWMVIHKKNAIKPSSYDRLSRSLDSLKRYPISDIYTDELTVTDIQEYVNSLVEDGYALTTIKKQFHLISDFVRYCNFEGLITKPLYDGVHLPVESLVKKPKKDVVAYTDEEQHRLLKVLERGDSPVFYVAIMMMETGMRIGEALALSWDDVDWRRRALRISKTVVNIMEKRKSFIQRGAKSYSSNRIIPLSTRALELLRHLKEFETCDCGLIFHEKYGGLLSYECVRWWTKKACEEAGVPYYGQHVFRHTFATNCYHKGCDVKKLSKFLGHSNVTITYNLYIHLFGDALEELRAVID